MSWTSHRILAAADEALLSLKRAQFLKGWSYRVMVVLKLKYFRYRLHSLLYMFNYIKDKQSYCIIKVIFIAVVNLSTTTIHRPEENSHLTKKSQSDLFPPILMHQKTIYWSYTEKIRERKRLTSWTCYLQGVLRHFSPCQYMWGPAGDN